MKSILNFSSLILCFFIILGFSCIGQRDYGPIVEETRKVDSFEEIEVSHGIDVYLTMGSDEDLRIEAPEDLLEYLVTDVKGKKLSIYFDRSFTWDSDTKVYVEADHIEKISTSGGSDVKGENRLKTKHLELKASGGSDIYLTVKTNNLEVETSGGADIILDGETERFKASSSGGSDIKAFDLVVQRAHLEASGGSDIKVTVEEEIDARASGGSDIEYRGNPSVVDTNTSSSGDIHHRN